MSHIHEALSRAASNGNGARPADEKVGQANHDVTVPWDMSGASTTAQPDQSGHEPHAGGEAESADAGSPETPRVTRLANAAEKLVITPATAPISIEQYRRVSAVLHLTQIENGTKIIMVASALPGEGKTLTATNLALTLSESYQRSVLLVDADLRRPTIHELFRLPNVTGLNDGLKSQEDRKLAIVQHSQHLSILTAGRPDPDPMSGLSSDRMRRVLAEASARFDWVVLDTPPIGLLPDAHLLSSMVDGIVLVVRAGHTPYAPVQRAVQALGRDRILGVVLNRVQETAREYGDEYYAYSRYVATGERAGELVR